MSPRLDAFPQIQCGPVLWLDQGIQRGETGIQS
jgi:hypothetical protein